MIAQTPEKETPACGGRRAEDAIDGGVRPIVSTAGAAYVNSQRIVVQETA